MGRAFIVYSTTKRATILKDRALDLHNVCSYVDGLLIEDWAFIAQYTSALRRATNREHRLEPTANKGPLVVVPIRVRSTQASPVV